jgi:hypothetical protein
MTSVVPFTALRCGLDAFLVDLDLYTPGLMPLHCATVQAAVMIQVVMSTRVKCYDLPKVGVSERPIRRTREGGSEWEPIKILLEGDEDSNKTNTASNTRLRLTRVG